MLQSRRHFLQCTAIGATGLLTSYSRADSTKLHDFVAGMPKAELHVHLEGTIDPATALNIAARNGSAPPYESVEAYEKALNFNSLASFLEAFNNTIAVLKTEEDYFDITYDYLAKCHAQNILYVDLKFDPQAHQRRGIRFEQFLEGMREARVKAAEEFGIASQLIMCFQRDASIESAEIAYADALRHQDDIVAIGLDNTEVLNFPAKFADLFARAKSAHFKLTSHCDLGQPNSIEHIRACIEDLQVDRLDHGYNILEDDRLIALAREKALCFTACPTSAFNTVDHSTRFYFREVCRSIGEMLEQGLRVTINTDDPGVMGNRHLSEVIEDAANYLNLSHAEVAGLSRNAFQSLWVPNEQKQRYLDALASYESNFQHGIG